MISTLTKVYVLCPNMLQNTMCVVTRLILIAFKSQWSAVTVQLKICFVSFVLFKHATTLLIHTSHCVEVYQFKRLILSKGVFFSNV